MAHYWKYVNCWQQCHYCSIIKAIDDVWSNPITYKYMDSNANWTKKEPICIYEWTHCDFKEAMAQVVNGNKVQYQFDGCWVDWEHERLDKFETTVQTIWNLIRCDWRYKDKE